MAVRTGPEDAQQVVLENFDGPLLQPCMFELEATELIDELHHMRDVSRSMVRTVCLKYDAKTCMNYVRSRYSLWRVAKLVQLREKEGDFCYSHVAACRPDTALVRPLVWGPQIVAGAVIIPNDNMWGGVNDRFALGDRTSMLDVYMKQVWESMKLRHHRINPSAD